jgi:O-antigen ligase
MSASKSSFRVPLGVSTLAAATVGGLLCGVAAVASKSYMVVGIGAAVAGCAVAGLLFNAHTNPGVMRFVAWCGLIGPLAVTQNRTPEQVRAAPVTPLLLAQGLLTVIALALVVVVARPRFRPLSATERWLLAFLAIALASVAWSVAPKPTFLWAVNVTFVYLLLLSIIRLQARAGVDAMRELSRVVHLLLGATLIGLLVVPGMAMATVGQYSTALRLHGVFPALDPNAVGLIAAAGIILVVGGYGPIWRASRALNAAIVGVDFTLLILSRSRAPVVFLALGLLFFYLQRRGTWQTLAVMIPLILLGLVVFATAGSSLEKFALRTESSENLTTLTGRTYGWEAALSAWEERPLTGLGFYSGHRLGLAEIESSNLDSLWVETILDLGPAGFVTLAGFVIAGAIQLFSAKAAIGDSKHLKVRRALFLLCLLSSLINPSLQRPSYFLIVFGFALLAPVPLRMRNHDADTGTSAIGVPDWKYSRSPTAFSN